MNEPVLILGINDRAALALTRYLGRRNIPVHIICYRLEKITLSSRYLTGFHKVSSPRISVSECLNEVQQIIELIKPRKIIPINDVWCTLSSLLKKPFINLVQLDLDNYFRLSNKWDSLVLLQKLGLQVPVSFFIENEADLEGLQLNDSKYIIKPIYSARLISDRIIQTKVRTANSYQQVQSIVRECINICPVIIQECVSGKGLGVNIMARSGLVEEIGITERLIEPKKGGASSYRTNRDDFESLKTTCSELARSLGVSGIFMVEFKVADIAYFMEINFRPWGSINTQLNSGINFFSFYVQDSFKKEKKVFQANLRMELERILRLDRLNLVRGLKRIARIILGKEKFDEIAFDDNMPAFVVISVVFKKSLSKVLSKVNRFRWQDLDILEKIDENTIIVCNGNINRSAFAANYIQLRYGLNIKSAGIIALEGRTLGNEYQRYGRYLFDGHLSSHVDKFFYNHSLKYIVFDQRQVKYLLSKGINAKNILRFTDQEVRDPYGLNKVESDCIFDRIIAVIDELRF